MAKSVNELILDAMILHQIHLLRFGSWLEDKLIRTLNNGEADIGRLIRDDLRDVKGFSNPQAMQKLLALVDQLALIRSLAWQEIARSLLSNLDDLADAEDEFNTGLFGGLVPLVLPWAGVVTATLRALVRDKYIQGDKLVGWLATLQATERQRIQQALIAGVSAGETSDAIARRVLGTSNNAGRDGVLQTSRNQLSNLTRSSVTTLAGDVRNAFVQANGAGVGASAALGELPPDSGALGAVGAAAGQIGQGLASVFGWEVYVAVLDSRTTHICRSLNGKLFRVGEGPHPPIHWGCRSLRFPSLNGKVLGGVPIKASFNGSSVQSIAELIGKPATARTFADWLRTQSNDVQDDVLGPDLAQAFRNGTASVERFNTLTPKSMTLSQLLEANRSAYRNQSGQ